MDESLQMDSLVNRLAAAARWYMRGGDISLFIALSLILSLYLGQDMIVSKNEIAYWLLILPALAFPALRLRQTIESLLWGIARPLAVFCALSSIWFLTRGDYSVVPPLFLLAWVSGWVLRSEAKINLNLLLVIFLAFYAMGVLRFYTQPPIKDIPWLNSVFTGEPDAFNGDTRVVAPDQLREGLDLNAWGVLPGQTAPTYGPWRISATPNIATSGTISFFVIVLAVVPILLRSPRPSTSATEAPDSKSAEETNDLVGVEEAPTNGKGTAKAVNRDQSREGLQLNAWGVLPRQTAPTFGPWRISATPNIATSGIAAFFLVIFAEIPLSLRSLRFAALSVGVYFLVLSFVRSALIAFCLFVLAQIILRLCQNSRRLSVAVAVLLVFGPISVTAIAPYFLHMFQDIGVVSRLALRGQSELSLADIYRQMYRPWLWGQHVQLFLSSEFWMGHGSDLAISALHTSINEGHSRSDSVSLPTRFLATYGLPSLAFFWFIGKCAYRHLKNKDVWAVSSTSAIIWLMMTWGSVFHPSNALFVLAILILGRGSDVFADTRPSTE